MNAHISVTVTNIMLYMNAHISVTVTKLVLYMNAHISVTVTNINVIDGRYISDGFFFSIGLNLPLS